MARDLFNDVIRPSVTVGAKRWYTLPLSIVAHAGALVVLVIMPLMAADALPGPRSMMVFTVAPPPPAPPAPPVARVNAPSATASVEPTSPDSPPLAAPMTISTSPVAPTMLGRDTAAGEGVVGGFGDGRRSLLAPPPNPPSPAVQAPLPVGGRIKAPTKTKDAAPVYPAMAMSARVEGTVIIEATIGVDGRVTNARVLRSVPLLDQAALGAVRQWEFSPTQLNGQAVSVLMTVTVTFTLR